EPAAQVGPGDPPERQVQPALAAQGDRRAAPARREPAAQPARLEAAPLDRQARPVRPAAPEPAEPVVAAVGVEAEAPADRLDSRAAAAEAPARAALRAARKAW